MTNFSAATKKLSILVFSILSLFALLSLPTAAGAVTRTWDGGGATNNWSDAANWSGDIAPTSADDAVFDSTSTKNAVINQTFTVSTLQIQNGYTGTITQSAGANLTIGSTFTQAAGLFQGSNGTITINGSLMLSGGTFTGGTGLITGGFGAGINQSGGAFSSTGDVDITYFSLSGGTFDAPNGTMTISADYSHTAGGTFNGGTGTVKFTGYQTYNCINQIIINVNVAETFNNLTIANSFCNQRYISAGDTLIVNGDFRIAYGKITGGRIRPLGTTTIDATNLGYGGSSTVEYVTPNRNFVINNPATAADMFPIEMNAANSTLTSSGAGKINFYGMNLLAGTLNQPNAIWDFSAYPGYAQSGGIFNGSNAQLNISNGAASGNVLTGGTFNGGTGLINGGYSQSGGTFSTVGDMNVAGFNLTGGIFNAPLGTLDLYNGFTHTSGGTFNARTGTVQSSSLSGVYGIYFDVNVSETFNNLKFNGTYNSANHGIAAGDTLIVNGTLNFNGRGVNGGSIVANGNVVYSIYGGYQNATTLVKFQDAATRTVTFCNDGLNCGGVYIQPTLVNNPNITINSGVNAPGAPSTPVYWQSLNLQQGTVNAGDNTASFGGDFAQSGGTFNGGAAFNYFNANFTLIGGTFNAAPTTGVARNFTHISGGTFNYGNGTMIFNGIGGTIDVNTTENLNNVRFEQGSTGTTKTIATGDTIIANGNLDFRVGYVSGGTVEAKGNVAVTNQFSGGNAALKFSGAVNQTFTNTGGNTTNGVWTINKPAAVPDASNSFAPSAPTSLLVSGNIGNPTAGNFPAFNLVSGNVVQTGAFNLALSTFSIASGTNFINEYGGTLTLAGDVTNEGALVLNGSGSGCPQADAISVVSSSAGTRRAWNGTGIFRIVDASVKDQGGSAPVTVYSGTDAGNNGANWMFDGACAAPTAATVTVGGRVSTEGGKGIRNLLILMTNSNGTVRTATTNSFGFYRFDDVQAGDTYIFTVRGKRYAFTQSSQVANITDENLNINFTGAAAGKIVQ